MTLIREYSILGADFDVISVDNAVVDVFSVLLLIFYVYDDVDIDIDDEFVLMLMLLMCGNTITPKSAEVDEDLHNLGLPIGRGQPHHYKIANIKVKLHRTLWPFLTSYSHVFFKQS